MKNEEDFLQAYLLPVYMLPTNWRVSTCVRLENGMWRVSIEHNEYGGIAGDYHSPRFGLSQLVKSIPDLIERTPVVKKKVKRP